MTGFLPITSGRLPIYNIFDSGIDINVEQVRALLPNVSCDRACARTLARPNLKDDDLIRMLWIEVSLHDPKPRSTIVRRITGKMNTRNTAKILALCEVDYSQEI